MRTLFYSTPIIFLLLTNLQTYALEPHEILVIANRTDQHSVTLAQFYIKKRHIPSHQLIMVNIPNHETCSRVDYVTKVAIPVRQYLYELDPAGELIRCLVLMYGMPLRIRSKKAPELAANKNSILTDTGASIDSELMLVKCEEDYTIGGWLPNPYYLGFQNQHPDIGKDKVLMVSRLDGPSPIIVEQLINTSIVVEQSGLHGNACFDARWPDPGDNKLSGYKLYDRSIHLTADRIRKSETMPVKIDDTERLFQQGECPNTALYCGWYSLSNYVDAFDWMPGSIGYHIASGECTTLKQSGSRAWCKMMLEDGITATLGPVGEPYVQAFPLPEIFFDFLIKGHLTLAECYMVSLPYISWKMVLIGDPLYFPFRKGRNTAK